VAAGIIIYSTIASSFLQAYCPPPMLGRVSASMSFLVYGAVPLGALLTGALADALTVRDALWVTLTIYNLSGLLLLTRSLRGDKDLPTQRAGQGRPPGSSPAECG
jgi:hypothetical protein